MNLLSRPIDGASLIFLRIFGYGLMTWEVANSLIHGDWVTYTEPKFHFSYLFLPWLAPLPPAGMACLFALTLISGIFSCLGLFYRLSSFLFFLSFTTIFLMDASEYINHLYFYSLLSFWMCLMPLHQEFSIDQWRSGREERSHLPAWMLSIILFQVGAVYFFAGVAKLSPHWLDGSLPRLLLGGRGIHAELAVKLMTYGGLIFDLLIAPALLLRRTRPLAFIFALGFHLTNVAIFGLVTFPWMMILLTSLFFDPSWPRKILRLRPSSAPIPPRPVSRFGLSLLGIYLLLQVLIPLRHLLHSQDPSWSEEGHQFSWRMKTRVKRAKVRFTIRDESGTLNVVRSEDYLTPGQEKDMAGKPDLILQFAHFLRDKYRRDGREMRVEASSLVSLNGRSYRELIVPGTNLAKEERSVFPYAWVTKNED